MNDQSVYRWICFNPVYTGLCQKERVRQRITVLSVKTTNHRLPHFSLTLRSVCWCFATSVNVLKAILVTERVPRESEPRNAHVGHAMAQRNVSTSVDVLYGTKWEAKRLKSWCASSASRPLVVFRRSRICIPSLPIHTISFNASSAVTNLLLVSSFFSIYFAIFTIKCIITDLTVINLYTSIRIIGNGA